ncbi:MAG: hypothetical protein J0H89_08155 [Rhizobiales bacterium]|jgi:hypothetical protein|nr:hypothetical protein [Hyphomicrobiales bacterium]
MANSHYLEKDRLANVIAAIQTLGVADRPTATLNRWVAELEASEELSSDQLDQSPIKFAERKKWQAVFEQHPEFFKTYTLRGEQRVLLRWRYAEAIKTTPAKAEDAAKADSAAPPDESKAKPEPEDKTENTEDFADTPSKPLTADQIEVLINTAIALHGKELGTAERRPERLQPFLMATFGAVVGTVAISAIIVWLGLLQSAHAIRLFD